MDVVLQLSSGYFRALHEEEIMPDRKCDRMSEASSLHVSIFCMGRQLISTMHLKMQEQHYGVETAYKALKTWKTSKRFENFNHRIGGRWWNL